MKNSLITLFTILLFFAYSCSTPEGAKKVAMDTNVEDATDLPGLEGSWKLIQFKETGDSIFTTWPQEINPKIKLVTNSHFTWVSYDEKSVIASGGGTYKFNGDHYTENIDFFKQTSPEDPDLTGTSVTFNCRLVGDKWYHSGYAKEYELDPETLDYVVVDSVWIDEIWERM
ncbi:hypothetical protein [Chondrinema litorale]|uniref:hypothetical protein n=1 Tax=Chondrinema litorale TaxID=2994555 RepID=UPI00254391EB|nr:hypothetical protein [Chondrinema litorale]UZR93438.1 hypothetical protein OQ292_16405 [Chondrinema litorale]